MKLKNYFQICLHIAINIPGVSFGNPRLSEDSESDHQELMMDKNMAFNPAVIMIEKKPQPQNTTNMASNNKPPNTTSESESDSDEDSSDDDSSDETKKSSITKPPTVNIIF